MPAEAHAALGASGSHRWMTCPGSIRLGQDVPDSPSSFHAVEGSAAHDVAERALREGNPASAYVGETYERDGTEVEVTKEMARAVQVYLDYVRDDLLKKYDHSTGLDVEVRFTLEDLDPPAPMFGTADAATYFPDVKLLEIVDYKHGQGVVVEPEDNPQLLYYALGAVLKLRVRPDLVTVTIVQPRADHPDGPVRSHTYGWDELVAFKEKLLAAAHAASAPDAPVGPVGDHCRWCPAKAICPAQQENALEVAQGEFMTATEDSGPPAPEQLSEDQLRLVLEKSGYVEDWFKEVRSYVRQHMEAGGEFPGYKLVAKRARRYWTDDEAAEKWMLERGIEPHKAKVRSPYQAEQAAKKKEIDPPPEDMIVSRSSGFNLAPDDNPRPAIGPADVAANEFSAEG